MRGISAAAAAAVLAAACVSAAAGKATVEVCSDSLNDFGISDVKLPDVVVAGEEFKVEVMQKPNKYVGRGRVQVEVSVEGLTVARASHALCDVTNCGLHAHVPSSSLLWLTLPAAVPAGFDTTVKITVNDHDGALLSCIDVSGAKVSRSVSAAKDADAEPQMLRAVADADHGLSLSMSELKFLFKQWLSEFGQRVEESDWAHRLRVFADNLERVAVHNRKQSSYKMGLNEFAHLTQEEFAATHFGFNGKEAAAQKQQQDQQQLRASRSRFQLDVTSEAALTDLPTEVDWTTKGAVTPVKNQGSCGSCWSFSATGALEGAYFKKTGKLVSFSEQELVTCDKVDQGCNGGLMDNAFRFMEKMGGMCSEDDYPYSGSSGSIFPKRCKASSCQLVEGSAPKQIVDVEHSQAALEQAVAQQPVAIAIEADQLAFQFYRKGVLTGTCGHALDHGVLLVGYGELDGTKFWKVKNSWGPAWGLNGYILLERGKEVQGGQCGLLLSASYPVL